LRDEQGSVKGYVGTITDLTELLQAKEVLRASLSEKEAMLKEIHHRVKNNLQIVTSLLDLQAMGDTNSKTAGLLRESRNRVRSMALVHETLYGTKDLGKIQLSEYLDQLCSHLFRSYGIDPSKVRLEVQIAEVSLKLDRAIPFGLIVNELISNALKYAFPEGRQGRIGLSVQPLLEHCFELRVTDDGVGLPDTFDIKNLKSLGLHLVRDLMIQLEGSLSYSGEAGTDFRMTFPMDDPA
jgi:two-component sensor histidine kinase